ncbi:MAG: lysophospholipase, partial [Bacteroidales bacterium]
FIFYMDFNIKLSDGLLLRGFINSPNSNVRAFIILVHGLGEHVMRYNELSVKFSREGIGFAAIDLPGHGRSEGKRGHIKGIEVTNEILDILLSEYRKTYRDLPVFLYGHSLGGGIVMRYLLEKKPVIDGAVVTSPWIRLTFQPSKSRILLARMMKHIFPSLIQPTGLVTEHLSHNNDIVDKYINDPLVHDKISVSLFYAAVSSSDYILKNAKTLSVPLLLLHGSEDQITSPDGSREVASKSEMITFRLWEGGYHELHNEPFRDEVFSFILSWINEKIS